MTLDAWAPASPSSRVAVFGGSFNPPHVAHVLACALALSTAPIDEVVVVPVYKHPFSKELVEFEQRLELCRLAMSWLPSVRVSTVERELGGESLTLRTLEHLRAKFPSVELRLLIGADVLGDVHKWHRWDRVSELAPPIVLGRGGVANAAAPAPMLPEVSSTEVRALLAAGEREALASLVPRAVLERVAEWGLYRRS